MAEKLPLCAICRYVTQNATCFVLTFIPISRIQMANAPPPFHPQFPTQATTPTTTRIPINQPPMGAVISSLRACIASCISLLHEPNANTPEGQHIARRIRVDFAPIEWNDTPVAPRSLSTAVSPYAMPPSPYKVEEKRCEDGDGGRAGESRSLDEMALGGGRRGVWEGGKEESRSWAGHERG
jgi:hypothetical protein